MTNLRVQLLLTGNELMSGDIVDSNSAMIAQLLKDVGIELKRKVTVSDDLHLLVEEIRAISAQSDVLIINGGLGPTVDDMTAEALAKAGCVEVGEHKDSLAHLENWSAKKHLSLTPQNLKQAMLPEGCMIIANSIGSAVGFELSMNDCRVMCTPGVPTELKLMLTEEIIPELAKELPEHLHNHVTRLQVFGIGESTIQKMIDDNLDEWPAEIELGFRASMPLMEVKLTTRHKADLSLKDEWQEKLERMLGDHRFNIVDKKPLGLADVVVKLLGEQKSKLTLVESCTGGMIASEITKVSGASAVFEAGFVTYSNEMKSALVNVPETIFKKEGAVSEACVLAMANGALEVSSADVSLAVSGVAGPLGGSDQKPVGTVWIAWGTQRNLQTVCLHIRGNRAYFQKSVTTICLDLIRRTLLKSTEVPHYVATRAVK